MLNAVGISTGTYFRYRVLSLILAGNHPCIHQTGTALCALQVASHARVQRGKATCSRIMICNFSKPIRFGLLQAVFENSFDKSAGISQPDAVNYFRQFPLKGTKFAAAMNVAKNVRRIRLF